VRFLLAQDRDGSRFLYSPLGSEQFQKTFREPLPNSLQRTVLVRTADGRTLSKSDAVLYLLTRSRGLWPVVGRLGAIVPRPMRNGIYRIVAKLRYRLFPPPKSFCPTMDPAIRRRFLS
jgi:predicted DCC family thiol-disulfide oxidoreductase YuxK